MLKRTLASAMAAGLISVFVPGVSHAVAPSVPTASVPDFNGPVRAIAHRGNTVYVGGDFTRASDSDSSHRRLGAAAFNRRTGQLLPWNPTVHGQVRDLAVTREGVYLVGRFNQVRRAPRAHIARVATGGNGRLQGWSPRANRPLHAVEVFRKRVFLGGNFTRIDGKVRMRVAAVLRTRPRLTSFRPRATAGGVFDLEATRSGVYIGGQFRALNNNDDHGRLALVAGKNRIVRGFNPIATHIILDIHVTRTGVYAAIGGPGGGSVLGVNRTNGRTVFHRQLDGDAQAVIVLQRAVYVGGHFNHICHQGGRQVGGRCTVGETVRKHGLSLRLNGRLSSWDPRMNGRLGVHAFDGYNKAHRLLVGGEMTRVNVDGPSPRQVGRLAIFG
jgi:hypothetical protein